MHVTQEPGVTIRDVADAAGVSVSTVSLTFNHPGRVREQTRRQVQRTVEELGFVPKAEAVARARRGVGRIGVLGPFTAHAAAGQRLNGVLRGVAGTDLEVVVFDHDSAVDSTEPFLTTLPRSGRLDGLLITSLAPRDEVIARLVDIAMPTVLIDGHHPGLSSVQTDDVAGGAIAGRHLAGLVDRSFGFLGERTQSDRHVSPSARRLAGFRQALDAAGYDLPGPAVAWAGRAFDEACDQAERLLSAIGSSAAVFASDDLLAAAVLHAARRRGLRVPDDVAVVGFDDSDLATVLDLSTVRQPLEESGEIAVRMLTEQIRRPGPARTTLLELELRPRGSTRVSPLSAKGPGSTRGS
jgi:DNA-binding LacI/PurR family transcriptional regulator